MSNAFLNLFSLSSGTICTLMKQTGIPNDVARNYDEQDKWFEEVVRRCKAVDADGINSWVELLIKANVLRKEQTI